MAPQHNGGSSGNMTVQAQRMASIMELSSSQFDISGRGTASEKGNSAAFEPRIPVYNDSAFSNDDASESSHATSFANSVHGGPDDKRTPEIAARENAQVKCGKFLVFAVLLAATAMVGFLTYWYITEEEKEDYQQQFQTDAKELIDISNSNGRTIMAVLNIFATLLSSTAIQSNATWPFYALPNFEEFGQQSRELSGSLLLAFAPRVDASKRAEWEMYSVENQVWIKDGLTTLGLGDHRVRPIADFIYRKTTRSFVPELNFTSYNPVWQLSPAPTDTSVINFNLFNHPAFKRLVEFSDFTREAAISEVLDTFLLFGNSARRGTYGSRERDW